jgi:hypothetical protein
MIEHTALELFEHSFSTTPFGASPRISVIHPLPSFVDPFVVFILISLTPHPLSGFRTICLMRQTSF